MRQIVIRARLDTEAVSELIEERVQDVLESMGENVFVLAYGVDPGLQSLGDLTVRGE